MRDLRLRLTGTVASRSDAAGLLNTPGDAVLVERGRPRLLVLMCPDGCGEELVINLDRQASRAWRLYRRGDRLTVYPSIWRDNGCESHFIISRNQIYLFGRYRSEDEETSPSIFERDRESVNPESVKAALTEELQSVADIADRIGAIPWDVLAACRVLVTEGTAQEGRGPLRGHFRKKVRKGV